MRKPVFLICCFLMLVCLFSLQPVSALAMESTCPSSFDVSVTLASGEKELSVYSDTEKTERAGRLAKGTTARVIGAEGRYLRISFDNMEGYAAKNKLRLNILDRAAAHRVYKIEHSVDYKQDIQHKRVPEHREDRQNDQRHHEQYNSEQGDAARFERQICIIKQ